MLCPYISRIETGFLGLTRGLRNRRGLKPRSNSVSRLKPTADYLEIGNIFGLILA